MTQIEILSTAKAQPSSRSLLRPDMDVQSDGASEFAQFWSVPVDAPAAKDVAGVLIKDVAPDPDVVKPTNVAPPENDQTPENSAPHAILQAETAPQNTQFRVLQAPETVAAQVIAPKPQDQRHPPLPVVERAPVIATLETPPPKQAARRQPARDLMAPPMSFAIPTAPILATLPPPNPGLISDELLDADLALPPVSQNFATSTQTAANALQRTYAPQVVHQVATAIVQTSGATTEIALNPEELGRVRISLTGGDTGLTVAIIAERPETADLMRRNIDHLTRELREMGYENLTFTFDDQSGEADQGWGDEAAQSGTVSDTSAADEHSPTRMRVALSGGLDLKL
jgi:flagellar hook-length control protein FliK